MRTDGRTDIYEETTNSLFMEILQTRLKMKPGSKKKDKIKKQSTNYRKFIISSLIKSG
jgi:hypothetical protein